MNAKYLVETIVDEKTEIAEITYLKLRLQEVKEQVLNDENIALLQAIDNELSTRIKKISRLPM